MAMINMEFLKQTTPYGCGLYAIANVLGLRYYVTQERLEASKNGLHMAALNEYLKETAHTIFIDVLYCNSLGYKLPEEWLGITGKGEINYMPLLLQTRNDETYHLIGLKLYKDGSVIFYDSLKDEPYIGCFADCNNYEQVIALYSFNRISDGNYVFL